ncbi:SpoIIE family protein phosphatase [Kamptonema formosum]|uniref:SpoIIE family protein phosphatase n=1 Tax=Kamptonema formosum TaxID=331992 RepID=UPI00034B3062|nr:SpoIIE family protein phosphatase [Oscillatoria sp. PCC 10802]
MEAENSQLLLAAGSEINPDALCRDLQELGYIVSVAQDGEGALKLLEEKPVDLAILDIQTPDLEGLQLLEQIKRADTLHQRPILALGGANAGEQVEKALAMGAEDFLLAPFTPQLLKARICECLEKRRLRDELLSQSLKLAAMEKLATDFTQTILPLGIALSAEKDLDRLLERIVLESKSICNADMGILYLRGEDNCLKFAILRNDSLNAAWGGTTGQKIDLPPAPLFGADGKPNDTFVAAYVAATGTSRNIPDIYQTEGFDFTENKAYDTKDGYRSVSCLAVPLKNNAGEVIGVVQLVNAQNPTGSEIVPFSSYQQQVVESLASQASVALSNQLLLEGQTKFLKSQRELEIGRMIQADFLPETLPQPAGWEIAARFSPARQVAGDFYDAFTMVNDTRVGLIIADVCDKGVGPAMFMALLRSLLRVLAQQTYSPDFLKGFGDESPRKSRPEDPAQKKILLKIGALSLKKAMEITNNYMIDNHSRMNMFATMFFGVLDPATGLLLYINGGHELPVICGPNGIKQRLKTTGPAVGMMPKVNYKIQEAQLEPGDILFTYTDGVPEAHSPAGALFTDERLLAILESPPPSAKGLVELIETQVREYIADADQFDDITMLAVRRVPKD